MKHLATLSITLGATLALGLAAPAADAQNPGRGGENGRGPERAAGRQDNDNGNRGGDRGRGPERNAERQMERRVEREAERVRNVRQNEARDLERRLDRAREVRRDEARNVERRLERDLDAVRDRGRDEAQRLDRRPERDDDRLFPIVRDLDRGLIAGCPPGLAKRNNGCLPPGQERKIARASSYWLWDRGDDYRYRFDEGYMYRLNPRGDLLGWLPALGGALAVGQPWPSQYTDWRPAPDYYTRYYGLEDRYQYRYADGALYGVDPTTQAIGQVAALLTGQPWTVGQPMPAGYDIYNVPYQYRSRYADTPDSLYRYSDGYVYQVDPTTQLVMAAIQLLA
ncbi:hypothetical protein [Brevundimonas viscosa]|uniref:Uncharacterized protein n=1 Tax=Brevundimonas viscosa TaxID=871741 RepID=A0A1I6Q445_9CAUL|nr:hypothetical protein [Brevundimonas viscosa]SFS47128.1 hypothetical protein SAMN05192570_1539 [Brevundimonas viscosa]